jgi:hypothetical protein
MDAGFEYNLHDYRRTTLGWLDRISLVTTGASVQHTAYFGGLKLRTGLDLLATFGGVGAFALHRYEEARSLVDLEPVVRGEGYYHAVGAAIAPTLQLELGPFDVGGYARFDTFAQIEGLDRTQEQLLRDVTASDRRSHLRSWIRVAMPERVVWFSVWAQRFAREGRIESVVSSASESSVGGGMEVVF